MASRLQKTFLLFTILLCLSGFSQQKLIGTSSVRNYSRSEINAGIQNWSIQQGDNGKMYFANNSGLLEFDGVNWRNFPITNNGLVRSLYIDVEGIIYAGGFNEIGYYKKKEDGFYQFHSIRNLIPNEYNDFDDVWRISFNLDGIIYQSFSQLMIYNDDSITVIAAPSEFHLSYQLNNNFYVNDMEQGLLRLAMGKLFPLKGAESLRGKEIWGILEHNDQMLISTASDGVFTYDGNSVIPWATNVNEFLKKNQIFCSYKTKSGILCFGTIQNGLVMVNTKGELIQHLNMSDGLQNNTILSIGEDNLGNLWLGTDKGIDFVEISSPLSRISYNFGAGTGYTARYFEDNLYLGTNQGLQVTQQNSTLSNNLLNKKLKIIPKTQGQVWSLNEIDGSLFCGHNYGTFIIEGEEAQQISDIPGGWAYIQTPKDSTKVIGGTYSGLILFEKINGQWAFKKVLDGFSESARDIAFDGDGYLWMMHGFKGVYRFILSDDYETILQVDYFNSSNSILDEQLFSLCTLKGKIHFLTGDGMFSYSNKKEDFIREDFFKPFIKDSQVRMVSEDKNHNIWYFTAGELAVLRFGEDGKYYNVTLPFMKLKGQFVNGFEFVNTQKEDHCLIATENGFEYYSLKVQKDYNVPFQSYINQMRTFKPDSVYYYSATDKPVQINYTNNDIEFTFSANDFENPNDVVYSTMLEGYEKEWSDWDSRNTKEYTNLFEGNYTFQLRSKNIYGVSTQAIAFKFIVSPPYYRSILAYIIYFIAFLIFLMLLFVIINRRLKAVKSKHEEEQARLFRKKEAELQKEALEAEKELIKMRNDKLRLSIKLKNKELVNSTYETIHKNEILIQLINELKEISTKVTSEENKHQLRMMLKRIRKEINNDKQWQVFETNFENVHEEFLKRIKLAYPGLSPRELKLCAYLRINKSSKEISLLMNISVRGVEISRYRLRKKLELDREVNLTEFILKF
ncbi:MULTISPECIES: triple tyrosine motif-containing protein [unclassified Lentimicrobium]|uniref:ligand-binding sensor domain-containing protein n=1 Tax=unclassified Lentimicrobium TaxID=2677434 RepID=UPI001552A113|nr:MULTISPECIES: triple tyrosine motif-containing protein [unclassified Lentimicrobium]NPD47317.1 hypothetical protein [Lentimicrobium sp. S6]NPD84686.1 hypothetical protein [Lentimicrobium sp. L6]